MDKNMKDLLHIRDQAIQNYCKRLFDNKKPYHPHFSFFKHLQNLPGTFVDVGANMGQSIISFAIFNQLMDIICFEPNTFCLSNIEFAASLVPNKTTIFDFGISNKEEELPLYVPVVKEDFGLGPSSNATFRRTELDKNYVIKRLLQHSGGSIEDLKFEEVLCKVKIYDNLDFGVNVTPTIVKIDVEGFERNVLEGMEHTIDRYKPLIMIEKNNLPEIKDFLNPRGYVLYQYNPNLNLLSKADQIASDAIAIHKDRMECFFTVAIDLNIED